MKLLSGVACSLLASLITVAPAQTAPRQEKWASTAPGWPPGSIAWFVWLPPTFETKRFAPVVVWLGERSDAATTALVERGFVVAAPTVAEWRILLTDLRRRCRIDQGGMHAIVGGDADRCIAVLLEHRTEFQTITMFGDAAAKADLTALRRLPARRVHAIAGNDHDALAAHVQGLHAERVQPGVAGEVAKVLDDFHDAATVGDEQRYFAILPDDAVFLGTDGTERWTGAEFRKFAMPYFERDSAWTYACLRRVVNVEPGDAVAWFDETLDNASYGECRGSGVLAKRDGRWVLRQYHLSIPVPNDVAGDVAARIRAFHDGVPAPVTTVVVVRHGEKVDASTDAELSDAGKARAEALAKALGDVPFAAVYTSQFRRTAGTVAPLCAAKGLTAQVVAAGDAKALAARVAKEHAGQRVLVCGHSNTVPDLLKALGVQDKVAIGDDEFDRLFVVTIGIDGPRLLSLRYR